MKRLSYSTNGRNLPVITVQGYRVPTFTVTNNNEINLNIEMPLWMFLEV